MTSDDVITIPHSLVRVSAIREPSNWIASSRPMGGQICSKLDDDVMMTNDDECICCVLVCFVERCLVGWVRRRHHTSDALGKLRAQTPRSPNHLIDDVIMRHHYVIMRGHPYVIQFIHRSSVMKRVCEVFFSVSHHDVINSVFFFLISFWLLDEIRWRRGREGRR